MESPKSTRENELSGVTSRSGRVIKKSTKLMDFTSPDDIEIVKAKKMASASRKLNMTQFSHIKMEPEFEITHVLPAKHFDDNIDDHSFSMKNRDNNYNPSNDLNIADEDFQESDSDDRQMVIKTEDDPEIEFATPRRSIYITEKSSKKKMMKDGKIVMGKAQRKDKGKTRYTAYMLWAKEARHSISLSNPELDFASVSKRLGEMWANVPTNVKYNWKRRAKRLANKIKKSNGAKGQVPQPSKYMQQKYYLNKTSTNSTVTSTSTTTSTPLTKQQKQLQKLLKSEKSKTQSIQNAQKQQKEKLSLTPSTSSSCKASPSTSTGRRSSIVQINKPLDLEPIDVAAHLKLLGESLINIGERLSQHEGQIAVSGSFSVLLDSILCAMGSLMCCLNYVPELNFQNDPPLTNGETGSEEEPKNLFQSIMDNVHYIMPGL
ncbi:CLUMA_CG004777, isoform A [Clunio marinus]|uniref:CLUMA_CG004777, isoform A n=1 Tax=Clunio marinus TaxID=568069 RepID=A0A1J1HY72_9DIPT|nr:CLUMA_CG004777, isoform A [Clunio marinus]